MESKTNLEVNIIIMQSIFASWIKPPIHQNINANNLCKCHYILQTQCEEMVTGQDLLSMKNAAKHWRSVYVVVVSVTSLIIPYCHGYIETLKFNSEININSTSSYIAFLSSLKSSQIRTTCSSTQPLYKLRSLAV